MMQEEIIRPTNDREAKEMMALSWGKFSMANYAWSNTIVQISAWSKIKNQRLVAPMIGKQSTFKTSMALRNGGIKVIKDSPMI